MDSCWSSAAEDLSHDCLISKGFVCICAANKKEELSSSDVDTSCVWCFDLGRYVTLSISQNTEGSLVLAIRDPKKRTCSRRLRQTEPLLQGKIDWAPHLMDGPILLLHRREKRSVVLRFVCLNSADSLLKSVTVTVPSTISVVPSTLHTSSDPRTRTTAITNGAFWLSINTEKFHSIISNSLEDNLRDETLVFSRPFDGLEGDNVTFGFECSVAMQIAVRECFVLKNIFLAEEAPKLLGIGVSSNILSEVVRFAAIFNDGTLLLKDFDGNLLGKRTLPISQASSSSALSVSLLGSLILISMSGTVFILSSNLQLLAEIVSVKAAYIGTFQWAPLKSSLLIIGDTSENGVGDLSFWLALDCCIYRSNVGQYFKYSCAANAYGEFSLGGVINMHDLMLQNTTLGEQLSVPIERSKKRKQNSQATESTKKRSPSYSSEGNQQSKLSHVISSFQARSKAVQDSSAILRCILRRKFAEAAVLLENLESLLFGVSTTRSQHLSCLSKDIQSTMKPLSSLLSQSSTESSSIIPATVPLSQSSHVAPVIREKARAELGQITLIGLLARVVDSDPSWGVLLSLVGLVKNTGKADTRGTYFTATSQPECGISDNTLKVKSAKIPKLSPNRSVFLSALITLPIECFQAEINRESQIGCFHRERIAKVSIGLNWISCNGLEEVTIGYRMATCIVRETDILLKASNVYDNANERISDYYLHHALCDKYSVICPSSLAKFGELFEDLVKPLDVEDLVFYSFLHIKNGCFHSSNGYSPENSRFNFSVSSALSYLQRDLALCGPLFFSSKRRSSDDDLGVTAHACFLQTVKEIEFCFRGIPFVLLAPNDSASDSGVPAFIVSLNASSADIALRTIKARLMPEVSFKLLLVHCQSVFASGSFDIRKGLTYALQSIVKEMQHLSVAFREMAKRVRDYILRSAPSTSDLFKSKRGAAGFSPAVTKIVNGASTCLTQKFAVLNPRLVCFDPSLLFRIIDASEDSDLAIMELMSNI